MANLMQIQGAKETWALEHQKLETDTPVEADLYGEGRDKCIRTKPICPLGGVYTIGAVDEKPACSIPGHQIGSAATLYHRWTDD